MQNIEETAKAWQHAMADRFGQAVSAERKRRGWTAAKLSERTRELGYPMHRIAISKIETGSRSGKLDVAEVITLALALELPPVELLFAELPDGKVEVWPGVESSSIEALQWFSGDAPTSEMNPGPNPNIGTTERVRRSRELAGLRRAHRRARQELMLSQLVPDEATRSVDEVRDLVESGREHIEKLSEEFRKDGWPVDE